MHHASVLGNLNGPSIPWCIYVVKSFATKMGMSLLSKHQNKKTISKFKISDFVCLVVWFLNVLVNY